MTINIVVIAKLQKTRDKLRDVFVDTSINITAEFEDGLSSLNTINTIDADMVLVALDTIESDVFTISEHIYLSKPDCSVLLLCSDITSDLLQKALQAGIKRVIKVNGDNTPLIDEIKKEYNTQRVRRQALKGKNHNITSKVITVFGTKGGTGNTTVAVNLAVKLSQMQKKVAIIDLNLQFGDVNVLLNIDTQDTIYELVQGNGDFKIDTVKSYMKLHSTGVQLLCAPNGPEYAEFITSDHIERLINVLRPYFDYIIIDTASRFDDCILTAVERSQMILFVTGLDISILKNSRISIMLLETLRQKDKIRLVINREAKGSITMDDATKILKCPIISSIPLDDKVVVSSLNKGVPFIVDAPRSKVSLAISQLAKEVMHDINHMKRVEVNGTDGKANKAR